MQTEDAIHLHRVDPARNMARFYRMSSTPSLFGDICLVREWYGLAGRAVSASIYTKSRRKP